MGTIIENPVAAWRKGASRTAKKHGLRIDMTPMVDLGFLLIAFFVMTTELSKPAVVNLHMPKDGPATTLGISNALTLLIAGNDKVYYYHGDPQRALVNKEVYPTSFDTNTGIGKIIREKQALLDQVFPDKEGRNGLMLLIKATAQASYRSVMDAIDETLINQVKKYAVMKPDDKEVALLQTLP